MKSKKGSHIGFVISFIVFITFAIFTYLVVQPAFKANESKKDFLSVLNNEISSEALSNLTSSSIKIDETYNIPGGKDCIDIEKYGDGNVFIKDEDNNRIEAYSSGGRIKINWQEGDPLFLKIFYSMLSV